MRPWYRESAALRLALAAAAAAGLVAACAPLPPLDLALAPLECLEGKWEIGEHELEMPVSGPTAAYEAVGNVGGLPAGATTLVEETPERSVWHFHADDRRLIGVVSVVAVTGGWTIDNVTRCPLSEERT